MKIAIISDTHDHVKNFGKVADFLRSQNIDVLLHCGDVCRQETVGQMQKLFFGTIYFVRGNGDFDLEQIPETMELVLGGKRIFFNHYPEIAKTMAESGNYDLVFYGHTHRPWVEQIGACKLANPGELAGQRFKPTFAIYDTQKDRLELKILEQIKDS